MLLSKFTNYKNLYSWHFLNVVMCYPTLLLVHHINTRYQNINFFFNLKLCKNIFIINKFDEILEYLSEKATCLANTLCSNYIINTLKHCFIIMIITLLLCTVECHYDAVDYSKILHKWLQELKRNINRMVYPQMIPHSSPLWASYGMSRVNISLEN